MTDTGRIPDEGLPENGGQQEAPQHATPAVPAGDPSLNQDALQQDFPLHQDPSPHQDPSLRHGAPGAGYAYHGPAEPAASAGDDDLLLMPGTQGAWSEQPAYDPLTDPLPDPLTGPLPRPETGPASSYTPAAASYEQQQTPYEPQSYEPRQSYEQQPYEPQQSYEQRQPHDQQPYIPRPAAEQPFTGQPRSGPAASAPQHTPARRPLRPGPPVPEPGGTTGGVVRSLADRGPAGAPARQFPGMATAPARTQVPQQQPPVTIPAYAQQPSATLPGPQLGEIPAQNGLWSGQPAATDAARTPVPAAAVPRRETAAPAETGTADDGTDTGAGAARAAAPPSPGAAQAVPVSEQRPRPVPEEPGADGGQESSAVVAETETETEGDPGTDPATAAGEAGPADGADPAALRAAPGEDPSAAEPAVSAAEPEESSPAPAAAGLAAPVTALPDEMTATGPEATAAPGAPEPTAEGGPDTEAGSPDAAPASPASTASADGAPEHAAGRSRRGRRRAAPASPQEPAPAAAPAGAENTPAGPAGDGVSPDAAVVDSPGTPAGPDAPVAVAVAVAVAAQPGAEEAGAEEAGAGEEERPAKVAAGTGRRRRAARPATAEPDSVPGPQAGAAETAPALPETEQAAPEGRETAPAAAPEAEPAAEPAAPESAGDAAESATTAAEPSTTPVEAPVDAAAQEAPVAQHAQQAPAGSGAPEAAALDAGSVPTDAGAPPVGDGSAPAASESAVPPGTDGAAAPGEEAGPDAVAGPDTAAGTEPGTGADAGTAAQVVEPDTAAPGPEAGASVPGTESAEPEAAQPEAAQPVGAEPEAAEPGADRPETTGADASGARPEEAGVAAGNEAGPAGPGAPETVPEGAEPSAAEPKAAGPAATEQPAVAEQPATEPEDTAAGPAADASTDPAPGGGAPVTGPSASEPSASDSSASDSSVSEPPGSGPAAAAEETAPAGPGSATASDPAPDTVPAPAAASTTGVTPIPDADPAPDPGIALADRLLSARTAPRSGAPAPAPETARPASPEQGTGADRPDRPDQPDQPAEADRSEEPAPPSGPRAPGFGEAEREAVLRVMRERRDIRNGFREDPVPHDVLLRVLEAAHHAPSVGHSQPWDFVVIRSAETRRAMHELAVRQREAYAKSLPKARAKQFKELKIEAILDTPVNIVVTADPTRGGRHTLGRHTQPQMAPYSSALAVENLWLAARAEGLGVGWVSFFDEREMVRVLGLPEHLEVVAYLCVGYVDEFPAEPELAQAGWSKRRPLSWVVHEETYGRRALPGEEPHDLLAETLQGIRPLDAKALGEAWERQKRMTKPAGALGMLEIISAQLSGLSRKCPPPVPEPAVVAIFAGDHGVHAQGVTPWPQEVTAQMVANFLGGGAVCNAFARQIGAEVCVVDVGVAGDLPSTPGLLPRKIRAGTGDFTAGPALEREEVLRAVEVGIETARDLVAAGNKALLTGEMGIANTTVSAALISVFTEKDPAEVTGRGTGISDETHARKVDVVRRGLELHRPDPEDPIGVLAAVGGLEHAALVGLILGGASLRTPVILDGVSAGAAALVARAIAPEALAACIAGHRSAEPGHMAALTKLGLRPLVDLDLRLGEGTGALLALPVVQSAARAMHEVATFDSAGVTEKS
ncbi:nicotinate-nucleotide--dimethylbenzimidazole phosphoribosyltransferase [Streptomyces sp. S07_1.15]|uniref:nicotinate-nucleotide--dimethylbenzimidazole phosphoribosyltransferase n=1 Tax=Streptomyces sp. S07_1.15 TaxID=2873925 RepID=UPI001D15C6F1|nr:nicotinate-nucleotide--dimethylbenzimidazole phosphoribosyltransferase [Streptomyces sp. S07_1.15]MCC3655152.1 nicotinate-nucleotide--dimethylbenzimidazole phosphoribosyltransferase [Streptomyces sp. S07_1.15]